jgi:hypothetical protein
MPMRMELVAGEVPLILDALASDDRSALSDGARFPAYLSLSGGMDPTWLDLFSESARVATDLDQPVDFIDARIDLGASDGEGRTVERVDPAWVSAVAAIPDGSVGSLTGRWIDRIEEELGELPREEKPWIRELAGRVVGFCRAADRAGDVVFVWEL